MEAIGSTFSPAKSVKPRSRWYILHEPSSYSSVAEQSLVCVFRMQFFSIQQCLAQRKMHEFFIYAELQAVFIRLQAALAHKVGYLPAG